MVLDIYFPNHIGNALDALGQANERAYVMALRFGANPKAAQLCRDIYAGALSDVAVAFGLALPQPQPDTTLRIPTRFEQP